ncbi:MAG: RNA polymerase sigma-70 factor, partial [Bacteroidetes bacterium]|nr:RNA polymerase sigma-70 factor [Bacteroidota bacterium]
YNERELLDGLKQGDRNAFARLYELYSERLYNNLLKLVKNPDTAEELLQDIFILVWEKRTTIEIHSSFRAYLFRIGQNKVYDFYRRLRRDRVLFAYIKAAASEHYSPIEENLLRRENAALLRQAIDNLPPQRRQVFELCKLQGKTYQEAGELLGIAPSTVNDYIVKATRSIREFMYAQGASGTMLLLAVAMLP